MKRKASPQIIFNLFLCLGKRSRTEGGYVIVVVGALIAAISAMLITAQLSSRLDSTSTKASGNSTAGFSAAEAGLNKRAAEVRAKFEGYNVPSGTTPTSATPCKGETGPTDAAALGDGDFKCDKTFTVQDYLYPNNPAKQTQVTTYVNYQAANQPASVPIPKTDPYGGLNALEYNYQVISTAYDSASNPTATLGMNFKSRLVPLFQFAAFYKQDLDFSNPPSMTLNGPIHTEGNLYLDSSSSATLTIGGPSPIVDSPITVVGKLFRGARPDSSGNSSCSGTVNIYSLVTTPAAYSSLNCGASVPTEYKQSEVNPTWGSDPSNSRIQIGVNSVTLPDTNTFNSDSTGQYWKSAQLRIALKLDSNTQVTDSTGNTYYTENPVSIEVENADGTVDTASTNKLLGNTCAATSTTIKAAANLGATSLSTNGATSSNFPVGSPVQIESPGTTNYSNALNANPNFNDDGNVVTSVANNTISVRKQLGAGPSAASFPSYPVNSVVRKPVVWTSKTFWNYREKYSSSSASSGDAKPIRMLNVDVQGLMSCASGLMGGKQIDDTTNGGLVWFLTVKGPNSASSANTYGIRLYNGASLSSTGSDSGKSIKGLSIVSDQAVYIRGDYNTLNKKPAAIMADSINVLSNAWPMDDAYSAAYVNGLQIANPNVFQPKPDHPVYTYSFDNGNPYNSSSYSFLNGYSNSSASPPVGQALRLASSTTIQAAFLAGIDLTGGGINNYPRMHEDWYNPMTGNRATLTYLGSMVTLNAPLHVNGKFCGSGTSTGTGGCNIYTPPIRNWQFDNDFTNAANLPPLSPRLVYLQQQRFSRTYDRSASLGSPNLLASVATGNIFSLLPAFRSTLFRF